MKKILVVGLLVTLVTLGGCGQNIVTDNQSSQSPNNTVEKAPLTEAGSNLTTDSNSSAVITPTTSGDSTAVSNPSAVSAPSIGNTAPKGKTSTTGSIPSKSSTSSTGGNTTSIGSTVSPESNSLPESTSLSQITPKPPQGITVNKINFQVLSELPDGIQDKTQRGFLVNQVNDGYVIVILAGEKRTGGYSLDVSNVEDNEGKTIIYVNESGPGKDDMAAMVITYPATAIKIGNNIAPNFVVTTTDGVVFNQLN